MMKPWILFTLLARPVESEALCKGGGLDCWKNKLIYQVIIDRFARPFGNNDPCDDLRKQCGGTFRGITEKLDYIQGLGVDAIWIGPVMKNAPNGYMGFWPVSLNEINPWFGGWLELKELIDEVHRRGMLIMVGFTANSMGHFWSDISFMEPPWNDFSMYNGCDQCRINGGGQGGAGCNGTICDCWIGDYFDHKQDITCQLYGMPDINETNPVARQALLQYVHDVVNYFGIDGVRLDAVPYMRNEFWREFSAASGVMAMGEVENGDDKVVYKYVTDGSLNSTLNYPLYYQLMNCFSLPDPPGGVPGYSNESRWGLDSLPGYLAMQDKHYGKAVNVLGNFVSNHDQQRVATIIPDEKLQYALVLTMMTIPGMPIIYYGQEQQMRTFDYRKYAFDSYREPLWDIGYPTDTASYRWYAALGRLRRRIPPESFVDADRVDLWTTPEVWMFARGEVLVAVTNVGTTEYSQDLNAITHWQEGSIRCNIFQVLDCFKVGAGGRIDLQLVNGESKLYVSNEFIEKVAMPPLAATASGEQMKTLIM